MQRVLSFIKFFLFVLTASAQTQQGYVKTKGRLGQNGQIIPGTRLSGATIMLTGNNATHSSAQGSFSFKTVNGSYILASVTKEGYNLVDAEILKSYKYSKNPLVVTMENRLQQRTDRSNAARQVREQLNRKVEKQRAEIEKLREQNKLTEEKYQEAMLKLLDQEESNQSLVEKMADEYSKIDYDLIDDFNRQFNAFFLAGELEKADSLLKTRGDIHTDMVALDRLHGANEEVKKNLKKSQAMEQQKRTDLAERCYKQHELFLMQHQVDSAAYYLKLRASLDTTNVKWQLDAGEFIYEYIADMPLVLSYYQTGLRQALALQGEQSCDAASCYNKIGTIYVEQANYDKGYKYLEKALTIRLAVLGENHPDVAQSYYDIGEYYHWKEDFTQALEYEQKALKIRLAVYGKNHKDVANTYGDIGSAYGQIGDYAKALEYQDTALAIRLNVLGEDNTDVATSYNEIGLIHSAQEDYSKAKDCYEKSIAIRKKICGTDRHPIIGINYFNLGSAYADLNDTIKAIECVTKAADIFKSVYGDNHPHLARAYDQLASLSLSQGQNTQVTDYYKQAIDYYKKVLTIYQSQYGENHAEVENTYDYLSLCYLMLEEREKVAEINEKLLAIKTALYGEKSIHLAKFYASNIFFYWGNQDYPKAIDYADKAIAIYKTASNIDKEKTEKRIKNLEETKAELVKEQKEKKR